MKPAEIVLRSREGERSDNDGGLDLTKLYCKYVCKRQKIYKI
jgi:hypothetical protein